MKSDAKLAHNLIVEDLANAGSWHWNVATGQVRWSPGLYRIFGLEEGAEAPSYQRYIEYVHPDDRDRVSEQIQNTAATGRPFHHNVRIVRADGAVRTLETACSVEADAAGETIALVGACVDVTEQERARRVLHRRESELRLAAMEHAPQRAWAPGDGGFRPAR